MKNLITENIGMKIMSFLIAFLLWSYVIITENPMVAREIKTAVEVTNLDSERFFLSSSLPEAKVRYRAHRRLILSGKFEGEIVTMINLAGKKEGDHSVKVSINVPPGLEVLSVEPQSINISIGKSISKILPVTPHLTLSGTDLYYDPPEILPPRVEIRGRKDLVDQATETRVFLEISKPGDFTLNLPIVLLNSDKKQVEEGLSINPAFTKVSYSVKPKPEKTVPVFAGLTGKLPDNLMLKELILEPKETVLKATPAELEKIVSISTEVIDLTGLSQSLKIKKVLIYPAGISIRHKEVTVTLKIVQTMIRKKLLLSLKASQPGYSFFPGPTVEVEIEGRSLDFTDRLRTIEIDSTSGILDSVKSFFNNLNASLLSIKPEDINLIKEGE
ncbi:MAG: CdaR family protein [Candidatus Wallbacteria bacterium]|nr:CdaR family protein [Candidatus Wallbacteria bacterium]